MFSLNPVRFSRTVSICLRFVVLQSIAAVYVVVIIFCTDIQIVLFFFSVTINFFAQYFRMNCIQSEQYQLKHRFLTLGLKL
jgi:hypothetical protein